MLSLAVKKILSATGRAQVFFLSAPFLGYFVELCIFSYPSPLEHDAPVPAKLVLLAIAGTFEYLVVSILADLLDICGNLFLFYIQGRKLSDNHDARFQKLLLAMLVACFLYRLRGFTRRLSKNPKHGPKKVFQALFWSNPGLLCFAVAKACAHLSRSSMRMRTMLLFWMLMAPGTNTGMLQTVWQRKDINVSEALDKLLNPPWTSIAVSSIKIVLAEKTVRALPIVLIWMTLLMQSYAPLARPKPMAERYRVVILDNKYINGLESLRHQVSRFLTASQWILSWNYGCIFTLTRCTLWLCIKASLLFSFDRPQSQASSGRLASNFHPDPAPEGQSLTAEGRDDRM
jgi:hypothetical protein